VFYVWFDALLNYWTALTYAREGQDLTGEFWPATVHVIAKDILKFHAVFWPALLMAAEIEVPRKVFIHGYLLMDEHKMSKSLGNVIDPLQVIDELGADALRFYLLREVQWGQDGSVTRDGLDRRYSGELANDLGNLVSRATAMIVRYREGIIPEGRAEIEPVDVAVRERFDQLDLSGALDVIWGMVRAANRYVEERQPWVLARSQAAADRSLLDTTLYTLADAVRSLGVLLHPFMPASAGRMLEAVGDPGAVAWERAGVGLLPAGIGVAQPPPLFPRA